MSAMETTMSFDTTAYADNWNKLKVLVESLDVDVVKSVRGNKTAAVRVRRGLREAKKLASEVIRDGIGLTKAIEEDKKSS
jgi:hypothetical protein